MNDFFSSKFVKDLEDGKLPDVNVTLSPETLLQLGATLFFAAVAIIIVAKIFKTL